MSEYTQTQILAKLAELEHRLSPLRAKRQTAINLQLRATSMSLFDMEREHRDEVNRYQREIENLERQWDFWFDQLKATTEVPDDIEPALLSGGKGAVDTAIRSHH